MKAKTNMHFSILIAALCIAVCVSCSSNKPLPVDVAPSDPARVGYSPRAQGETVLNEVLINFYAGTQDFEIHQLAEKIGGQVVGYVAALYIAQIRFPNDANDPNLLYNIIDTLTDETIVKVAHENLIFQNLALTNDYSSADWGTDDNFAEKTWGQRAINLPAAWDITVGTVGGTQSALWKLRSIPQMRILMVGQASTLGKTLLVLVVIYRMAHM